MLINYFLIYKFFRKELSLDSSEIWNNNEDGSKTDA